MLFEPPQYMDLIIVVVVVVVIIIITQDYPTLPILKVICIIYTSKLGPLFQTPHNTLDSHTLYSK